MKKCLFLFGIHLFSFFHKLRHDLARELVLGFCSLIILSLFYYVFNDFLNSEVKSFSPTMRDAFASVLAWILLLASAFAVGRLWRAFLHDPRSLLKTSLLIGESPSVSKALIGFHSILVALLVYLPVWLFVGTVLVNWSLGKQLLVTALMLVFTTLSAMLKKQLDQDIQDKVPLPESGSVFVVICHWRLYLMFWRKPLTQFALALFGLCLVLLCFAVAKSVPFAAKFILCFWGGFMGSCALCFQFSDDLEASYLEKSAGVSHATYLKTLVASSLFVALLLASLNALAYVMVSSLSGGLGMNEAVDALRLFFVTAVPPWLVPNLLFHLDARRPVLPLLVCFLVGLFV